MPPKKKKNAPKNSFYFYMLEFKSKREAEGFTFPGGLKDAAEAASPSWKGLDPKTKQHFENLAERAKASGNGGVRYTSQGRTFEEVENEKKADERKKIEMQNTIEIAVQGAGRDELKHHTFYFIHVNYYCQRENHQFVPCELSVLAYRVQDGYLPKNLYHTFIDPGVIPNGYTFRAMSHTSDTHKTPLPPNAMGSKDYLNILESIIGLVRQNGDLEDDGNPPPMYTLAQCIPEVEDTLRNLGEFSFPEEISFRVYPLEELFYRMKNFGLKPKGHRLFFNNVEDEGFPFLPFAAEVLKQDIYDYSPGIACDYHDDQDVRQHCSRSKVIRWSYILSDNLCANLDVGIREGQHTPIGTNFNAVVITSQMDKLTVTDDRRQSCGRGKPIDGHAANVRSSISLNKLPSYAGSERSHARSERSHAGSEYSYAGSERSHAGSERSHDGSERSHAGSERSCAGSSYAASYAQSSRSSSAQAVHTPLTIIDHGKSDNLVPYLPEPSVSDGPLRQPKSKGKCSMVNALYARPGPINDGNNFPALGMGAVGRGQPLKKS